MSTSDGRLYRIMEWARRHGDVSTMGRIRMKLLPLTVKERIVLDRVTPETPCSEDYLRAMRTAVSEIVGKECPL